MSLFPEDNRGIVTKPEELVDYIKPGTAGLADLSKVCDKYCLKVPEYYLKLINWSDPHDPLKKMCIPDIKELESQIDEYDDPIGDYRFEKIDMENNIITHRYEDRGLLHVTHLCGGYCRFCFRKGRVGKPGSAVNDQMLETAFSYLRDHREIREVILTGGDPLMLGDNRLDSILGKIETVPHVEMIRIHTRMPVWDPGRISDSLAKCLDRRKPLIFVTHINHPNEITQSLSEGLSILRRRQITLLNQSVLLAGVNDSLSILQDLSWGLINNGIIPYYIHHLDKAKGISHFRVKLAKGIELFKSLQGTLPGYAMPRYVLDIPGGYGKIPVQHDYIRFRGMNFIELEDFSGGRYRYREEF